MGLFANKTLTDLRSHLHFQNVRNFPYTTISFAGLYTVNFVAGGAILSIHTLIENWLSQTSLSAGGVQSLDDKGFWAVSYGSIALTLAVPENDPFFVLYAPLMSVSGGNEQTLSRFYRRLLIWQLQGDLPAGMAFGMDYDGTLVSVVGQYRTQGLDATSFDTLLREAAAAAESMRSRLESLFEELVAEETTREGESRTEPEPVESHLSDHELLYARLMQSQRY